MDTALYVENINHSGEPKFTIGNAVMDLEHGIAAFLHSFKKCCTDIKAMWHYAPLKIKIEHYCYL